MWQRQRLVTFFSRMVRSTCRLAGDHLFQTLPVDGDLTNRKCKSPHYPLYVPHGGGGGVVGLNIDRCIRDISYYIFIFCPIALFLLNSAILLHVIIGNGCCMYMVLSKNFPLMQCSGE